jgi:hypothetical protein
VVARAQAALDRGDLASAIKEIGALPAPAGDAFSGWLDQARARASANDTLTKLQSTLLAWLGAPASPEAKP